MKKKMLKAAHSAYRFSNSWTGTMVIIVLFVIFFIAQAFRIPSGSMKDFTFDWGSSFCEKICVWYFYPPYPLLEIPLIPGTDGHIINGDTPKRGDIVIFRYPNDTKLHYVKRCVALPGDELFVMDKILYLHPHEGNEYAQKAFKGYTIENIDGKMWVKDPYTLEHEGIHHDDHIVDNGVFPAEIFNTTPIIVPDGQYFMMGDNRDHSNDSRFWGAVPYGLIEGTPWFVYFSLDDDYQVRWDRIGKTPHDLEQGGILKRAQDQRIIEDAHNELY